MIIYIKLILNFCKHVEIYLKNITLCDSIVELNGIHYRISGY